MVDYALKPSLARYEFRQETEFVPAVSSAKDPDETLLAMVQQQADIASSYIRQGDARKAIATLRRAYKVAADHGGADVHGGDVPAARRLAFANIRLQLCAVLSRLGRHEQALVEARAAKFEADEVWRTALGGCSELSQAAEEGNLSKPAAPLRRLLMKPPPWLQSVVEASVQARQCIAVELEFGLPASPDRQVSNEAQAGEGREGSAGLPPAEEMRAMHREAVLLAQQLLPEQHPTREGAERTLLQLELRRQEALDRTERTSSPVLHSPEASVADVLLKRGRHRSVRPAALDASLGERTANKLLSAVGGNMGLLNRRSVSFGDLDGPVTHESLFSPPGDVFNRSFKRTVFKKKEKGSHASGSPGPTAGSVRTRSRSESMLLGGGAPRDKDPFRAWKLEVMDVNKMTMKEIKSRSFEGIREMQADVKKENLAFKSLWLKETDPDILYENRMFHSAHGAHTAEKAERKYLAWKKKAYQPSEYTFQKREDQKKLFAFYGVPMSNSEPDLKAWGRVLRESHARTPAERERLKHELEEKRRRDDEARRRWEEEDRVALQSKVGGVVGLVKASG